MSEQQSERKGTGRRKTRVGVVVSDKMEKTIVVSITRRYKHKKYHKYIKSRKRYKAHDETNSAATGDRVLIEETRPLSREKRWKLKEIIEKAPVI